MNRVFVTGASGFMGQHLVAALAARGACVRCLVRPTSRVRSLTRQGAELCLGDVTQPEVLRDGIAAADVVFHLAGLTRALHVRDLMRINAQGTWNVARACAAQARPPVLVVVSSLAAAGPSPPGRIRAEGDPRAGLGLWPQ